MTCFSLDGIDFSDINVIDEDEAADSDRFDFINDSQWSEIMEARRAPATLKKLKFVNCLWQHWREARNSVNETGNLIPLKELTEFLPSELCQWLPFF